MAPIRVSAIICAYTMDRWSDICDAIESLRRQTRRPDQIILVIDHNEDLLARATAALPKKVLVIANQEARGLSGARNTGIAAATGDLIAFIDDDVVVDTNWLDLLIARCEEPDVLGASSWVEPQWVGARPSWFPQEFLWTVGCSHRGLPTRETAVRNLIGAAMIFKRAAFSAAGGFRSELGRTGGDLTSCEETEFCLRANARLPHGRFILVPAARAYHKVPGARLTWKYFWQRCRAEGRSKAYLTHLVQSPDALDTERAYVLRTLIGGVLLNLRDTVVHFNFDGAKRAMAILIGLAATISGYAAVRIEPRWATAKAMLRVGIVE
jgi:glucosyl-dolichyl phosphate glucuronosyltransferase